MAPAPPATSAPPPRAATACSPCGPASCTRPSPPRAEQKTDSWQTKYALRAGVEGTINQALDVTGLRRARYRGLPRTSLQHAYSATAINVIRLDAHWAEDPQRPWTSRLSQLAHQLAA
ncbi:transposase [Kitasatospora sp. MAP12-44]|uniref:transposase n=1 Tax=unclassified Kitasatospora TaxID=2633591 RepID=UPI00247570DE|nr:transposase [Kitasatospora sp. MAP12-44]